MRISKKISGKRQSGFVVAAELLLITTILVLGLITGFTKVRDQTLAELSDTGSAIGAINQSYQVHGTQWITSVTPVAEVSGFAFTDQPDTLTAGAVGGDTSNVIYGPAPAASLVALPLGENGINAGITP